VSLSHINATNAAIFPYTVLRTGHLETNLKQHNGEKSNKGNQCDWQHTQQAVWGDIWKPRVEKSQINATNVTMPRLRQVNWKNIWKCTVEKIQINKANVTLHVPSHSIWEEFWKCTVKKSQTNVTNVTMHPIRKVIWEDIWNTHSGEKPYKCNQCDFDSS